TFLQPFLSYTTKTATSFGFNTESSYDWEREVWTVPLNWSVSQVLKLGGQPLSASFGARYYAEKPRGGPEWGLRLVLTLLFPK
ncbi:MAG TPA: transporter, partial [Myxococcota bacterium]|nr:transporter [Myxococcota bacterium]